MQGTRIADARRSHSRNGCRFRRSNINIWKLHLEFFRAVTAIVPQIEINYVLTRKVYFFGVTILCPVKSTFIIINQSESWEPIDSRRIRCFTTFAIIIKEHCSNTKACLLRTICANQESHRTSGSWKACLWQVMSSFVM